MVVSPGGGVVYPSGLFHPEVSGLKFRNMKKYIYWKKRNMNLLTELYNEVKADIKMDFDTFCRKINCNIPIPTKND